MATRETLDQRVPELEQVPPRRCAIEDLETHGKQSACTTPILLPQTVPTARAVDVSGQ